MCGTASPSAILLLLWFRKEPDTLDRVRTQVAEDYRRMPHQVSDRLLLVAADGIASWTPQEQA